MSAHKVFDAVAAAGVGAPVGSHAFPVSPSRRSSSFRGGIR